MNGGQMMITIGALMLLSIVILRVNTGNLNTSDVLLESKIEILATSIANSIIEEAFTKEFDEYNVLNPAELLSNLTPVNNLKAEGEKYDEAPYFDDMDDFNGLDIAKTISQADSFNISCEVYYVNPANPEIPSTVRTWNKKIIVKVTSRGMLKRNGIQDTIKMSSVRSYWYF
jgi:hypothetical protein